MRERYTYKYDSKKHMETARLTLIQCDKLQADIPKWDAYDVDFGPLDNITYENIDSHDPHGHLRSLKKWHFRNAKLTNQNFNAIKSINTKVRVTDENIQKVEEDERRGENFKSYEFIDNTIDPLEEFEVPDNKLTDHVLYILMHSPCFSNLRVIDMRGNNLTSLATLKVNYFEMNIPNLEELYLSCNAHTPVMQNDISFFFLGLYEKITKLHVLWLEANHNPFCAMYDDFQENDTALKF
mmetsp:Transcript_12910/g.14800  ORF Transcript_12910/g.14800 Transcript_12910/m.14800 type:complete len:239 (-) Transcript_12910:1035-1751(-)